MSAQLPAPGEVFLDHVGLFVPAMDEAASVLERCGFRLTPYTVHRDGDPPAPTGTANRCAMLRRGYVEVLTAASDTPLARQLRQQVGRYVGWHLVAFASSDAEAQHARLDVAGFPPLPIVRLRRPATDGSEARFTVVRFPPGVMPEGRIQFLTHHTEAAVWREEDMAQPNGAVSLEEVTIVVPDPDEATARYRKFVGPVPVQGGNDVPLHRGRLRILGAEAFAREMPFVRIPSLPFIAAVRLGVADLGRARSAIDFPKHETGGGAFAVVLPPAAGGTFVFSNPPG
jgi:catechol 2,3-dioxygenase-like lactoylglutathione lyase family enzyme